MRGCFHRGCDRAADDSAFPAVAGVTTHYLRIQNTI